MAENPTVTAVVRTYERPDLVQRAIDSVLAQTYDDYELLVVDDHSEDRTPEVVEPYTEEHDHVRYIRHEENKGPGPTFNTALQVAEGEYIAYLDDDDEWLPEKLEAQVDRMETAGEEYGLCTGVVEHVDMDTGETFKTFRPTCEGDVYMDLLRHGSGSVLGMPSAIMLRMSAMDDVGEFDDLPRGSGQDLYRRLTKEYKVTHVDVPCLRYYVHDDRITTHASTEDVQKDIYARETKLERFGDDFRTIPEGYARELETLGSLYLYVGEKERAYELFRQAREVDGWSATLALRYALSVPSLSLYQFFFTPGFRFRKQLDRLGQLLGR
ncbi:glycosyltransferase family 2 protein [Haloarchaeobius salinus]|uniref:glycosyltransferase family 2 protein n=1 Tax=Haloarchaeobius salinus TaxID=1198298 RepID=UPI0021096C34|nr:glycosyltransferase family 2 protein [Haloarchaeobius salinus]